MLITDAATTPVVAASMAPTRITAIARPERTGPNTCPMVSSRSSAIRLRSRIRPMNVKNGIASSTSLAMMPYRRSGSALKNAAGTMPSSTPIQPNTMPVAAREKATGKPVSKNNSNEPNMIGAM